jgi:hypothetical protein
MDGHLPSCIEDGGARESTYAVHLFCLVVHVLQFLLQAVASVMAALMGFPHPSFCLVNDCAAPRNAVFKIFNQLLLSFAQLRVPDLKKGTTTSEEYRLLGSDAVQSGRS